MTEKNRYTTPIGRFSYPSLSEPNDHPEYGDGKYQVELLIAKDVFKKECRDLAKAVIQCAQDNLEVKEKGKKIKPTKLSQFTNPFKDGDVIADEKGWESYAGHMVIKAKTQSQPPIVNGEKKDLNDKQIAAIKGGDYGRLIVNPYSYPQQGGGITLGLQLVQFWKEGDAFGGASKEDLLADIDELETPLDDPDTEDEELELEEEEVEEKPKKTRKKKTAAKRKKKAPEPEPEEDDEDDDSEIDLDDL